MPEARPPRELTERTAVFLTDVEREVPGLVVACHLTGSGSAGDWQHDSDIDLVFVTSRLLTTADAVVLGRLHSATAGDHSVDGIYLTATQVAGGPDDIPFAPQAVGGELEYRCEGGQLTWVTWLEMAQGFRAPIVAGVLGSWSRGMAGDHDPQDYAERAREASRRNLRSYWWPYVTDAKERLTGRADGDPIPAHAVEWTALGAPRLVVTIETGRVVSKTAAASYTANRWPQYAELLARVVASRRGERQAFTVRDGRLAVALVLDCIAQAVD